MITLSSDFKSPYPAAMKGVIASRCDARMIDISHEFSRHNVREAAFWLTQIIPWFPPAVHLVVVDPGVGTSRRAIVVSVGDHSFVGPDNGVLIPVASVLGSDEEVEVYGIPSRESESSTFHGRDVFAPMAAALTTESINELVADERLFPIDEYESLRLPSARTKGTSIVGEVLVVDGFGNVITNIPEEALSVPIGKNVLVNGTEIPFLRTYGERSREQPLVTIGSHNNIELAVREGRGDEFFELSPKDEVRIEWEES